MRIYPACVSVGTLLLAATCLSQVLTVAPNGKSRTVGLTEEQKAILLPALQNATGDHSPNLLNTYTAFPEPLAKKELPAIIAISVVVGCGASHPNCIFLVFRQENGNDIPILNSVAGDYDLQDSRHHGYRDIVLKNYQGIHTMISQWQYDGTQYHVHTCEDSTSDGKHQNAPLNQCGG